METKFSRLTATPSRVWRGKGEKAKRKIQGESHFKLFKKKYSHRELIYLNLGGNRLNRVPTQAISRLQNMITLELEKNRIESIKESDFFGKNFFGRRQFLYFPMEPQLLSFQDYPTSTV
jgi:hypothetical protein